ncbi:MAG: heavy metal translocating P-type ATPase [Clostridiaceae bacterium]
MEKAKKSELILEGLSCANCAAKIEAETSGITGVKANMNFVTKVLTLEYEENIKSDELIDKVTSIIHHHEPDVEIKVLEKNKRALESTSETFILEGLDCANCAAKMEDQIGKLEGIGKVHVDFVSKRLNVTPEGGKLTNETLEKITSIVSKIEPDTKVVQEIKGNPQMNKAPESEIMEHKEEIVKILASSLLLAIGMLFTFPTGIEFAIFAAAYLLIGGEILLRAGKNIARGQVFDENFLMSIATLGAFFIGEYPEGVAVMLFYQVGDLFQDLAVNRSRKSIADLMDIRPDFANLLVGDELKKVSPEDVKIGDSIVVKPGEKIPLDGTVTEGNSAVDTSALTGESLPRELEVGAAALSGFININGVLRIEVTKVYDDSTVAKILELVQNASSKKAPTENFITKFARYYTPFVVFSAAALAIIPPLVIGGAFSEWLYRALVFLVISCPCALVVSIPLGFFGGIGGASKKGILIKGGNFLEALNDVETVIFDKTGTLTKGVFKVTEVVPSGGFTEEDLMKAAAYAETYSNHPIAKSIIKAYGKEVDKQRIESYEEVAGHGIVAVIDEDEILAGNKKLMIRGSVSYDDVRNLGTVVYISINGKYAGHIVISDEVKDDSLHAILELKALGIKNTVMLTGDSKAVGKKIGEMLEIDEVYSELLPIDKVERMEHFVKQKSPGGKIIFVGDGINDAPVLARADIGIAMGGLGSDAAIEAADIVIMTDEPSKIPTAIKIAKRTRNIVWQNISFSLGVKLIFLIMGALGLANMWEAVFADVGVTIIAVINAARAINMKNI